MSIEIEGLGEIFDKLERLSDTSNFQAAMGKACALIERSAKEKAPKGNGELRNSIQSNVEVTEDGIKGIVFSPLEYAPYVEYGTGLFAENGGRQDVPWCYKDEKGEWHTTSGMNPQPYMRPALNENRKDIIKVLKGGLKDD